MGGNGKWRSFESESKCVWKRERVWVTEYMCVWVRVCVCVCVYKEERECEWVSECVCVCLSESVCVCERESVWVVSVSVSVWRTNRKTPACRSISVTALREIIWLLLPRFVSALICPTSIWLTKLIRITLVSRSLYFKLTFVINRYNEEWTKIILLWLVTFVIRRYTLNTFC